MIKIGVALTKEEKTIEIIEDASIQTVRQIDSYCPKIIFHVFQLPLTLLQGFDLNICGVGSISSFYMKRENSTFI